MTDPTDPASSSSPPPSPSPGRLHAWRWPLVLTIVSALAILAIVVAVIQVAREFSPVRAIGETVSQGSSAVEKGLARWRSFTATQITERQAEFVSGLPFSRDDLQLVVQRVDLTQNLYAESNKTKWGIDFGTTRVLLSVPARLFYAIDLSGEQPVSFQVNIDQGIFHAYFPDPAVLAVEIYDERTRELVDVGWGRFKSMSGDALKAGLENRRYQVIRDRGESPEMIRMVRDKARPVLARFVALYLNQSQELGAEAGGFQRIEIHFAGDAPEMAPVYYDEHVLTREIR